MMANTTQDSAGIPWNSVRIGDRNLSAAFERTMIRPSMPPMTNAPASPARMRNTVAITSQNIEPVVKISMQRQNTSTNDGNRKRGKKSEANCHSAITTTNGKADIQTLFAIASITLDAEGGD